MASRARIASRAAWLAAALWSLAWAAAWAQFDFQAGSVLQQPGNPVALEAIGPAIGQPTSEPPAFANSPGMGGAPPLIMPAGTSDFAYHFGGKGRGYYLNDQRIEFTGVEATFAVEGVLEGGVLQRMGEWDLTCDAQLFLNQPFGPNILADSPERRSFAVNFDIDPLQISQLYLGARRGDYYMALGRFVTPFGRFYFPNYRNNFDDSPFIRAEAIHFRETGLLLQWDPGIWVFQAALTNGSFLQDTNSSKALVARVGIDQPWYALGASIKMQDGNGSETQKMYNNHAGVDAMIRFGSWTLSGEAIYDQYGLRRPGMPLDNITWARSLYYRDLNNGFENPFNGFGYYANLGYEGMNWTWMFNYGEFYPQQVGIPQQDAITRRGMIKGSRHWTRNFETYGVIFRENDLANSFAGRTRRGSYVLFGCQFVW